MLVLDVSIPGIFVGVSIGAFVVIQLVVLVGHVGVELRTGIVATASFAKS